MNSTLKFLVTAALVFVTAACRKTVDDPEPVQELEAVDLGLSVKWASYNVGAHSVNGRGSLFAWGETQEKTAYSWSNKGDYAWGIYNSKDTLLYGMTRYSAMRNAVDSLVTVYAGDTLINVHTSAKQITICAKDTVTVGLDPGNVIPIRSAEGLLTMYTNNGRISLNAGGSPVSKSDSVHVVYIVDSLDSLKSGPNVFKVDCHPADTLIAIQAGDGLTGLLADDDPATAVLGKDWRTPSVKEMEELLDETKCEWSWDSSRGGYVIKGIRTGNSIFLPAAGYCDGEKYKNAGSWGYYWTSSLYGTSPRNAESLFFNSGERISDYVHRYYGMSVRAVYGQKD